MEPKTMTKEQFKMLMDLLDKFWPKRIFMVGRNLFTGEIKICPPDKVQQNYGVTPITRNGQDKFDMYVNTVIDNSGIGRPKHKEE